MQPQQDQNIPSGELPSPQYAPEGYPAQVPAAQTEQQQGTAIEQGLGQPQGQVAAQGPLAASQATVQMPVPLPPPLADDNSSTPHVPMPQIADDSDLIEKEWVTKAKHIVEQTRHDPRAQNIEVNKIKADYLKMRYNKDLKLSDS